MVIERVFRVEILAPACVGRAGIYLSGVAAHQLRRDEPVCICGTLACVGYVRRASLRLNVITMCVGKHDTALPRRIYTVDR
jgi:hypothetical protein